jgi:plastocyanin
MRRLAMTAAVLAAAACTAKTDKRPDSIPPDSASAPAVSTAAPPSDKGVPAPPGTVTAAPGTAAAPSASSPRGGAQAAASTAIPIEDQAPVAPTTVSQPDTTITMRAHGTELVFDPATITLKQGTRVRIRFANAATFAHNFILARSEDDLDELIHRARDANENVPRSLKSKMLAYSNIAQPSQTVEFGFVVPPPGDYFYVCLVEGHANTMIGKLKSLP